MAYKRDLANPLAPTFGPGDKVGDQKNAPRSAMIGKGLAAIGGLIFGNKIGTDKMRQSREKRLAKRELRKSKRKN